MALDYQRVFWSDFRGNVRWRLLSPLQKLAFFNLIACQHEFGGILPSDPAQLRNLAEIPYEDWAGVWTAPLTDWFPPVDGEGNGGANGLAEPKTRRLTLVDAEAWSVLSEAGKRGAEARWGKGSQCPPHSGGQSPRQCSPSPSPSPSPLQKSSPSEKSRDKRASAASKTPSGPYPEVVAWWMGRYQEETGARYAFQAKDGAAVKRLLDDADGDVAAVRARGERFFSDPFWREKLSLQKFAGAWNELVPARVPVLVTRPEPVVNSGAEARAEREAARLRQLQERQRGASA